MAPFAFGSGAESLIKSAVTPTGLRTHQILTEVGSNCRQKAVHASIVTESRNVNEILTL